MPVEWKTAVAFPEPRTVELGWILAIYPCCAAPPPAAPGDRCCKSIRAAEAAPRAAAQSIRASDGDGPSDAG